MGSVYFIYENREFNVYCKSVYMNTGSTNTADFVVDKPQLDELFHKMIPLEPSVIYRQVHDSLGNYDWRPYPVEVFSIDPFEFVKKVKVIVTTRGCYYTIENLEIVPFPFLLDENNVDVTLRGDVVSVEAVG